MPPKTVTIDPAVKKVLGNVAGYFAVSDSIEKPRFFEAKGEEAGRIVVMDAQFKKEPRLALRLGCYVDHSNFDIGMYSRGAIVDWKTGSEIRELYGVRLTPFSAGAIIIGLLKESGAFEILNAKATTMSFAEQSELMVRVFRSVADGE